MLCCKSSEVVTYLLLAGSWDRTRPSAVAKQAQTNSLPVLLVDSAAPSSGRVLPPLGFSPAFWDVPSPALTPSAPSATRGSLRAAGWPLLRSSSGDPPQETQGSHKVTQGREAPIAPQLHVAWWGARQGWEGVMREGKDGKGQEHRGRDSR